MSLQENLGNHRLIFEENISWKKIVFCIFIGFAWAFFWYRYELSKIVQRDSPSEDSNCEIPTTVKRTFDLLKQKETSNTSLLLKRVQALTKEQRRPLLKKAIQHALDDGVSNSNYIPLLFNFPIQSFEVLEPKLESPRVSNEVLALFKEIFVIEGVGWRKDVPQRAKAQIYDILASDGARFSKAATALGILASAKDKEAIAHIERLKRTEKNHVQRYEAIIKLLNELKD